MAHGKHRKETARTWKLAAGVLGFIALCLMATLAYLVLAKPQAISNVTTPTSTNQVQSSQPGTFQTNPQASLSTETQSVMDATVERSKELSKEFTAEKERAQAAATAAQEAAKNFSDSIDCSLIVAHVPEDREPTVFSLNEKRTAPKLTAEDMRAIQAATTSIEEAGYSHTALFLDMNSGQGIAINAGEAVYTASSFKAPLSDFLLEHALANEWEMSNIEASILHSDNEAFEALASNHMNEAYQAWLEEHAIAYDAWSPWYPHASAKAMTACWADIYHYIQTDDKQAAWFKDLLANTNISFIRNALEDENVQVWNKGGWLADPEYNAVTDCGIIESGEHSYLMAVLTNQPTSGETQGRVQNLARALWDCKEALA